VRRNLNRVAGRMHSLTVSYVKLPASATSWSA